jgi:hypothetical protein
MWRKSPPQGKEFFMTARDKRLDLGGDQPASTVSGENEFQAFLESHRDWGCDCDEPREPSCTTQWQKYARARHPEAKIFGDGPFAVKLPCRRLSYYLFFDLRLALTVFALSGASRFTCSGNCREVKTVLLRSLRGLEFFSGGK